MCKLGYYVLIYLITAYMLMASIGCQPHTASTQQTNDSLAKTHTEAIHTIQLNEQVINQLGIRASTARHQIATRWLEVNGQIAPPPESVQQIASAIPGYVRQLRLIEGKHVAKGEILFYIESLEFIDWQRRYLELCAQLEKLEKAYRREQELAALDISARKNYEQAYSEYQQISAQKSGLEAQFRMIGFSWQNLKASNISGRLAVRAPNPGVITQIYVTEGTYVQPQQAVVELLDESHVHVELNVFEKDLGKISKGQMLRFVQANQPDDTLWAEVVAINATLRPDRTVNVHAHFKQPPRHPIAGAYVQAWIAIEQQAAWVIPQEAIVYAQNQTYLWQKQGCIFQPIPIRIFSQEGKYVAFEPIGSTWQAGDSIVTQGAYSLLATLLNHDEP